MKFSTIAIAAASAGAVVSAHDFSICSGVADAFGLSSVTMSPDPVQGNTDLSISFAGKPTIALTDGATAMLKVSYFGIAFPPLKFDACNDLDISCPTTPSTPVTGGITYHVPTTVVAGTTVQVQIDLKAADGSEVTCVKLDATLGAEKTTSLRLGGTRSKTLFTREITEQLFAQWMEQHGIAMPTPKEFLDRLDVFGANLESIAAHNSDPKATYKKAMNAFGHMTSDEFKRHLGFSAPPAKPTSIPRDAFSFPWSRKSELPTSVNWYDEGAVNVPMNQGSCGSCWTFSTTGAMEGAYFIQNGQLVSLSEQQLTSCDTTDDGCSGGLMDNAFKWIESNGGLCTEEDYPYASSSGTAPSCETTCTPLAGTTPSTYTDVDSTEAALMAAVVQQPVSIAIEADQNAFQFYSSGVLTGTCGTTLDHGVLAVGYGTQDGTDYWRVKNSWGTSWGDDGFINIERGNSQSGGLCGILLSASYPTL